VNNIYVRWPISQSDEQITIVWKRYDLTTLVRTRMCRIVVPFTKESELKFRNNVRKIRTCFSGRRNHVSLFYWRGTGRFHPHQCRESREQYRWFDIATTSRQRRLRRARINLRNERQRGRNARTASDEFADTHVRAEARVTVVL